MNFIFFEILNINARIRNVDNHSMDVLLGTLFINHCISGIFLSYRKIVAQDSRPVTILSMQRRIIGYSLTTEQ